MADLDKVLKGFERCMMESDGIQDNPCADCPYLSKPGCSTTLKQDAVELLKSKQAEIERLKAQPTTIETEHFKYVFTKKDGDGD